MLISSWKLMFESSLTLETRSGSGRRGWEGGCIPLGNTGARENLSLRSSETFVPETPATRCQGSTGGCVVVWE